MKYVFAAERKLIFFISAGGKNRLVEFSDRNSAGASQFSTDSQTTARAIRKTSLYRRGVIVQSSGPTEEEENAALQQMAPKRLSIASVWQQAATPPRRHPVRRSSVRRSTTPVQSVATESQPSPSATVHSGSPAVNKVMEFANFTLARESLSKLLDMPKSKLRNPTALNRAATNAGITIKYVNP